MSSATTRTRVPSSIVQTMGRTIENPVAKVVVSVKTQASSFSQRASRRKSMWSGKRRHTKRG